MVIFPNSIDSMFFPMNVKNPSRMTGFFMLPFQLSHFKVHSYTSQSILPFRLKKPEYFAFQIYFFFLGGDSSVHSRDDFIDSADDDDDDDDDMSTYGGHLVRLQTTSRAQSYKNFWPLI